MVDGLQVPVIPFPDTRGRAGATLFKQNGPIGLNVGVSWLATTIFIVTGIAQLVEGVKVYNDVPADDVLIVEGFQLPVIPLFEIFGRFGAELF